MISYISLAFALLVAMATLQTYKVQGQSYHFSNGWNPGKRSMQESMCRFRPDIKALVFKLIEDEVFRMLSDSNCLSSAPTLRNFLKKDLAYTVPMDDKK